MPQPITYDRRYIANKVDLDGEMCSNLLTRAHNRALRDAITNPGTAVKFQDDSYFFCSMKTGHHMYRIFVDQDDQVIVLRCADYEEFKESEVVQEFPEGKILDAVKWCQLNR